MKEELYVQILELIKNEEYHKILEMLKDLDNKYYLDNDLKSILLLIEKLTEIQNTRIIPESIDEEMVIHNTIEIIEKNCFEKIFGKISNERKFKEENDIINLQYILLNKIINLKKEIKTKEILNEIFKSVTYNEDIENILTFLIENKRKKATQLIKIYLKKIHQEKYQTLIFNLIYINEIKKIPLYENIYFILDEISRDEYEYTISPFLYKFYKSLDKNHIEKALIYLNILRFYSYELISVLNELENSIEKTKVRIEKEKEITKRYLLEQIKKMKEKDYAAIIIDIPVHNVLRNLIYETIREKEILGLRAFSIGEEDKRIVLRYLNPDYKCSNSQRNYKKLYKQKHYEECIHLIKEQLSDHKFRGYSSELYSYLGLSYYHLNNINEAFKCLTISYELNKIIKYKSNIIDESKKILIKLRKEKIKYFEEKTPIEIEFELLSQEIYSRTEKYEDNKQNKIDKIENIAYYVIEGNISLEEACQRFELTKEDLQLIKLIYARDYYIKGMYFQGDKLLQDVEKDKNKTSNVIELLKEIRINKKFYAHRKDVSIRKRTKIL